MHISYSNPVLYPSQPLKPFNFVPWSSSQISSTYPPHSACCKLLILLFILTQKCPTTEDTAFPGLFQVMIVCFFFSSPSWLFQNIHSSFFLKIPSIFEDYIKQCHSSYCSHPQSLKINLVTCIPVLVASSSTLLLDHTSASFAGALDKLLTWLESKLSNRACIFHWLYILLPISTLLPLLPDLDGLLLYLIIHIWEGWGHVPG